MNDPLLEILNWRQEFRRLNIFYRKLYPRGLYKNWTTYILILKQNSLNSINKVGKRVVLATNWQFSYHHPKPLSDRVLVFNSFFLSSFIPLWTIFYERDRKSREGETLWAHSIVITWRRHLALSIRMNENVQNGMCSKGLMFHNFSASLTKNGLKRDKGR